jgi:hypothetical protein
LQPLPAAMFLKLSIDCRLRPRRFVKYARLST